MKPLYVAVPAHHWVWRFVILLSIILLFPVPVAGALVWLAGAAFFESWAVVTVAMSPWVLFEARHVR